MLVVFMSMVWVSVSLSLMSGKMLDWEPDEVRPWQRTDHLAFSSGAELFLFSGLDGDGHILGDMWSLRLCCVALVQVRGERSGLIGSCCACQSDSRLEVAQGAVAGPCAWSLRECLCACRFHQLHLWWVHEWRADGHSDHGGV